MSRNARTHTHTYTFVFDFWENSTRAYITLRRVVREIASERERIEREILIRYTIVQRDTIKVIFHQSQCRILTIITWLLCQAYRQ